MDVQKKLDEIVASVEGARSMPMSASCVVNRAELLGMLAEVRAALPDSLAQAQAVLGDREQMVDEARREAERIVASAHAERGSLVSDTQVARKSQDEADRILADARRDSEELRAEADDYVDSKLANFEVVLTKTIAAVDRGREKLLGRGPGFDDQGLPDVDAPERSHDPEELRRQADTYVDAKLASFEAVLGKTLDAVGRGRQKLLGRRPMDELGDHTAGDGEQDAHAGQSDADYMATLAGQAPQAQPGPGGYGYDGYQDAGYGAGVPQAQPEPQPQPQLEPQPQYTQDGYAVQAGYPAPGYDPNYGWQQQSQYGAEGDPAYGQAQPQGGYQPQADYGQGGAYGQGVGGYAPQPDALQPQQPDYGAPSTGPGTGAGGAGSLDETSFFDTGLIDLERLRELDGGR